MRDWGIELEEMGFENGEVVPVMPVSEPAYDPVLDELEPPARRATELFAQTVALNKGLEMARTALIYVLGDFQATLPAALVEKNPCLPEMAQRAATEQTRLLAITLFQRLLAQISEEAPAAWRLQVDLFDTTFGLGINPGRKLEVPLAARRHGMSPEAWQQAQNHLCQALEIVWPLTPNSSPH